MLESVLCLSVVLLAEELPRPPAGWKLEVVAQAPAVRHPAAVTCAPDGRVFVGEDPMDISAPADAAQGRVLCVHPDGRITVFAEGLHAPFGLLYLEGKLYVHHSPRFSVFCDGDEAGTERADLIECTNPVPWALDWNDHVPANVRLAMDGFLYMSVGDKGVYGAVGRDGMPAELHGGGVLRLRPDATALEVYSTGTRNHLDVAINAEDEVFTYDNTDERDWWSRVTHMVDGGYYGYPWDHKPPRPWTLPAMAEYGAGAATAGFAYNEDALPEEYHGNLFLADFGKREILRLRIARAGATYEVVAREEFLADAPADFRPVGLALAPDGLTMYIGDWQHRDVKARTVAGRLLRLTYTGESHAAPRPAWFLPAAMGRAFEASTLDLLEGLSHPARSVRLTAQRRIAERGIAAVGPLAALLADRRAPPRARWHALWALDAIGGGNAARGAILAAARDADARVRRQAVRQLGIRRVREAREECVARLGDADAAVRFQAATALGRLGDAQAVPALRQALADMDRFVRFAARTALGRLGRADPDAWPAIACGLGSSTPAAREETLFVFRECFEAPAVRALAGAALNGAIEARARAEALEVLAGLHRKPPPWRGEWWAYHPVELAPPAKVREWEGTVVVIGALLEALGDEASGVRRGAVAGLRVAGAASSAPELRGLFQRENDVEVKREILVALAAFGDGAAADLASSVLDDGAAGAPLREAAVRAAASVGARGALVNFLERAAPGPDLAVVAIEGLGRLKAAEGVDAIARFLENPEARVRIAAVGALGAIGGERAVGLAMPRLDDPELEVRRAAVAALGEIGDRKGLAALLGAFEREETRFEAAGALARLPDPEALDAYLYGLGGQNASLRERCRAAIAAVSGDVLAEIEERLAAGRLSPTALLHLKEMYTPEKSPSLHAAQAGGAADAEAYVQFSLKNQGDGAQGHSLFSDPKGLACLRCHKVKGEGGEMGPDLSGIGSQYSRRELAESVMYPSRAVREGYRQVVIVTRDGLVQSGVPRAESAEDLVLLDAEGKEARIAKRDILERNTSELSIMPEGLTLGLSLQDFANLVAYLESLRGKPSR